MKEGYETLDQSAERAAQDDRIAARSAPAEPRGGRARAGPRRGAGAGIRAGFTRRRDHPPWISPARASRSPSTGTGRGQLLFDIGVAGDFVGNLTQPTSTRTAAAPSPGWRTGSSRAKSSSALFGQIDPYARAVVAIEAGEEERRGRSRSTSARPTSSS